MSKFALAHAMKKKKMRGESCMADGGDVDSDQSQTPPPKPVAPVDPDKLKSMGMDIFKAEGGEIESFEHEEEADPANEMIKRIMMAKGGVVERDGGEDKLSEMADSDPNEFDDMALDDHLDDATYTGENSGDEHGDAQEDHDRADIISRIMKSRAKKDRLPNPR
jgi:hypothetical protein